ncbi:PREDICTED: uncharacterized protein LOC105448744 [Wasmannia auropunctata]|uniref:uncharacterized protein LOC105448744 n=1 Tax=Wasmannia auropunctata TaxID=64793 RepID=UPI0005EE726A|nr:PREDICTED: uncharacterized protein LOC105448744 [Wasmannia auropunctata]
MSFFDFFRNFLGVKRNEPSTSGFDDYNSHRESFRNPIWQSDEDDDDDDSFRHPESSLHFNIFNNPLEMTLYFESQIDNILKNFFGFNNAFFDDKAITAVPFAGPDQKDGNLRDRALKSKPDAFVFANESLESKVDTDLDGRVSTEEFSKMWNKGNTEITKPSVQNNFSIGRFVRKEITRRSDGTIEKKQVIRDSEGNEETIISKEADNKTYVVTIKKDKNGIETKSEDLFNMDESELTEFNQKWKASVKDNIDSSKSIFNRFPWEKFFGPNPKL